MKRLVVILLMVLSLIPLSSEAIRNTPGEFTIRGYRLNRSQQSVQLTVVDALTGSLREIKDGGSLDIDGYYTPADASVINSSTVDDIAFSYRVVGNTTGKFTVKFTVTPFIEKIENGSGNETNGDKVISTSYFLVNETVRFLYSNQETSSDYKENEYGGIVDGQIINETDKMPVKNDDQTDEDYQNVLDSYNATKQSGVLSSTNTEYSGLKDTFSVTGPSSTDDSTDDIWIARGALGFVVDSSSFDEADEGTYKASITITLTQE